MRSLKQWRGQTVFPLYFGPHSSTFFFFLYLFTHGWYSVLQWNEALVQTSSRCNMTHMAFCSFASFHCCIIVLQEAGPNIRDPTPCRRTAYQLTLEDPSAGGTVATAGGRHVLAIYILLFCGGLMLGISLIYFVTCRRNIGHQSHHLPDNSLSSEKGRDLLGSSATPQSPSSASLLSEGFRLTEKRNGTATTNTSATLLSNQGNGGHHYSGTLIHSNPSNGHGNSLYASSNRSSSGLKFASEILAADMLDGRTGEMGKPKRMDGQGDDVDEGLGDGVVDGIKGLEEELASFPMFKAPAPLARCEESSI